MPNEKTLKVQMAYISGRVESHGDKLDTLIRKHDKHERESNIYREQQATNTEAIKNIKEESLPIMRKLIFAGYALAGSAFLTGVGVLIKYIWFTK